MALKHTYWTISEAAKQYMVTRQTISRWISQGNIRTEKIGREILIRRKDLTKFHYNRLNEAASDSILALYKKTIEDYCREKGYIQADEHVELVGKDIIRAGTFRKLSEDEKREVFNRFKPTVEKFLKDFYKMMQDEGMIPKNLKGEKQPKK
jgi:excisionase family DNA binding protein